MSVKKTQRARKYSVFNHRDQPVEVHLADRVLVLAPGETAEVTEQESCSEHLRALQKNALITVLISEAEETEPVKPPAMKEDKARTLRRGKTEKH